MGKFLSFIYGIFAYLLFLITALYMIGFLGNFIVPKSINTGIGTTFGSALVINLLLLSVFAVQHSLMARPSFKDWMKKLIHPAIERSTYVLLSNFALLLLFWQWQPMKTVIWEAKSEALYLSIMGLFGLGWLIVFASSFMISHWDLVGLKQVFDNWKDRTATDPKFETNYLYRLVRHPLMLGFLIVFWTTPYMTVGHLLFAIILTLYVFIAVKYLEEKDLRKVIGKEYEAYQENVPMLIPFTKRGK